MSNQFILGQYVRIIGRPELLTAGAKEGDSRLAEILAGHVRDGVCSEAGNLLQRWDGLAWRRADESEYRRAA